MYESSKLVFSICHAPATKLFHFLGSATRNWTKLLSSSPVLLAVQSGFPAIFLASYFLSRQSSSSTYLSLLRITKVLIPTPVVLDTEGGQDSCATVVFLPKIVNSIIVFQ